MKKKIIILPCIAAVAIATYVGKKTFESHANETSSLLMQNVEALSQCEGGVANKHCPIWNVSYTTSFLNITVTCSTGGSWKCVAGKCPHGR